MASLIEVHGPVDMGASRNDLANAAGAARSLDDAPVEHRILHAISGPFHVGDRNAPKNTGSHRLGEFGAADGPDVSIPLQRGFFEIDAARHVDRQHQLQIDGSHGPYRPGRQARENRQGKRKDR